MKTINIEEAIEQDVENVFSKFNLDESKKNSFKQFCLKFGELYSYNNKRKNSRGFKFYISSNDKEKHEYLRVLCTILELKHRIFLHPQTHRFAPMSSIHIIIPTKEQKNESHRESEGIRNA